MGRGIKTYRCVHAVADTAGAVVSGCVILAVRTVANCGHFQQRR